MPLCKACRLIMPVNEDGLCFICEMEEEDKLKQKGE